MKFVGKEGANHLVVEHKEDSKNIVWEFDLGSYDLCSKWKAKLEEAI